MILNNTAENSPMENILLANLLVNISLELFFSFCRKIYGSDQNPN